MRRVLALVGAVALVVGALWIHGDLEGGSDGTKQTGGGGTPTMLCASELGAVCDALERSGDVDVVVEPAGSSAARLATLADDQTGDPGFDGWLTLSPEVDVVRDSRSRSQLAPLLGRAAGPIARSPLVLAIWKDRAAVLRKQCGGDIGWKCVGDAAGRSWASIGGEVAWGDVKPGHESPEITAAGLDIIGQAASQYFGRTDLSIDDFEDDAFLDWFTRLERAVRPGAGATAFEQMLAAGRAAFDVVATTQAQAGPLLARASADRRNDVNLLYPAPVATADVVYAPVVGSDRGGDAQDVVLGDTGKDALARAGWHVSGRSLAPGVPDRPPLPARSNLPDAGSLQALFETWREVVG
jgi:hypothetical protein